MKPVSKPVKDHDKMPVINVPRLCLPSTGRRADVGAPGTRTAFSIAEKMRIDNGDSYLISQRSNVDEAEFQVGSRHSQTSVGIGWRLDLASQVN